MNLTVALVSSGFLHPRPSHTPALAKWVHPVVRLRVMRMARRHAIISGDDVTLPP
jgi:hypothetical protein